MLGRMKKKCCKEKKQRQYWVVWDSFKNPPMDAIIIGKNGKVVAQGTDGKTFEIIPYATGISYERSSGKEKRIVSLPVECDSGVLSSKARDLFEHFNRVFAVDTNTKKGVSSVCALEVFHKGRGRFKIKVLAVKNFRCQAEGEEEKTAIRDLIEYIKDSDSKISVVTDHDLANHQKYNRREVPLLRDFYLPKNVKLAYASADKKNDSLENYLMWLCDKIAGESLRRELKGEKLDLIEYLSKTVGFRSDLSDG